MNTWLAFLPLLIALLTLAALHGDNRRRFIDLERRLERMEQKIDANGNRHH